MWPVRFLSLLFPLILLNSAWCSSTQQSLALRTGRNSCWAQFRIDSNQKLCFSRQAWSQQLRTPDTSILKKIEIHREMISELLSPIDSFGILRSLILHEGASSGALPMFRRLGFVHLVSSTGIHFYAFCALWDSIIRKGFNSVRFGLYLGRISAFLICAYLWLLAGARMGMLRAGLVILVRKGSELFGFQWTRTSPLLLALVLELLSILLGLRLDQGQNSSIGRWIYALSVGGGLCFYSIFRWKHLGLALGSWIPVAVLEIWEVGCISIVTPLFSLMTLPVICSVVYPMTLLCIAFSQLGIHQLGILCLQVLGKLSNEFIFHLTQFALQTGNLWVIPRSTLWISIPFATLAILARNLKYRVFVYSCLILSSLSFRLISSHPPQSQIHANSVVQLDVGQGDSALITGSHPGLIDTGSKFVLSDEAWLRNLTQRQVTRLDWVALTHLDEDHAGALLRLLSLVPIRCVTTSELELKSPKRSYFVREVLAHLIDVRDWSTSCVPYPTLGPQPLPKTKKRKAKGNENMGAVLIPLKNGGFYLSAGDASAEEEIRIGNWAAHEMSTQPQLGPRILKISHHGSRFSTHPEFLRIFQPDQAWISVGKRNSYGHPSIQTLHLLKKMKIPVFRTDQNGSLNSREGVVLHPPQRHLPSPKTNLLRERISQRLRHLWALPLFREEN